jgi:hypothetical protein
MTLQPLLLVVLPNTLSRARRAWIAPHNHICTNRVSLLCKMSVNTTCTLHACMCVRECAQCKLQREGSAQSHTARRKHNRCTSCNSSRLHVITPTRAGSAKTATMFIT